MTLEAFIVRGLVCRFKQETTCVVMPKLMRVEKLLAALASGAWVVSVDWIKHCQEIGTCVHSAMADFELHECSSPTLMTGAQQSLQLI